MTLLPEGFRPMKGESAQLEDIKFPCLASPKIDAFRCIVGPGGVALGAKLEPIPNKFVQDYFQKHAKHLVGLDGELAVGEPDDPNCFKTSCGALRRSDGDPDFTFWVFDHALAAGDYFTRYKTLSYDYSRHNLPSRFMLLSQEAFFDAETLACEVRHHVKSGYEGTMVRSYTGPYKHGKSTIKEGYLLKLKSFVDHEAVIIGVEEEMANTNAAEKDALGRTKRSSAKAGKIGKGTLGGFLVRGLNGPFKGVEFKVATGSLTKAEKAALYVEHLMGESPVGQTITYKHMEHSGGYNKPRHAGFMRFRPDWDITE